MATKKMTAQEVAAFDWAALIARLSPIAAAFLKALLDQLLNKQLELKTLAGCPDCPQEIKDACCADMDKLAEYVLSRIQLHEAICGSDCKK
jgi:hypothetical protein